MLVEDAQIIEEHR